MTSEQTDMAHSGSRPFFLTPEVERVLDISLRIAQELAVTRARVDTLERLLEAKGIMTRAEIESFLPDPEATAERARWNTELIRRVLRILEQEASRPDEGPAAGTSP